VTWLADAEVAALALVVVASVLLAALAWPSPSVSAPPPPTTSRARHARPVRGAGSAAARMTAAWATGQAFLKRRAGTQVQDQEVADALVLIALTVRAGLGLPEALAEVHGCSRGAARRDLGVVLAALRWGRPAGAAWDYAGSPWRDAALAWQVASTTGAPPAQLFEHAAGRLRDAQEREAERRAARAGVLLVLPLGFGFLPAFACTAVVPVVVALAGGVLRG
jgi:Flp pilus assembly protein TadB